MFDTLIVLTLPSLHCGQTSLCNRFINLDKWIYLIIHELPRFSKPFVWECEKSQLESKSSNLGGEVRRLKAREPIIGTGILESGMRLRSHAAHSDVPGRRHRDKGDLQRYAIARRLDFESKRAKGYRPAGPWQSKPDASERHRQGLPKVLMRCRRLDPPNECRDVTKDRAQTGRIRTGPNGSLYPLKRLDIRSSSFVRRECMGKRSSDCRIPRVK